MYVMLALNSGSQFQSRCCFHLRLDGNKKTVSFLAPDPETRNLWFRALHELYGTHIADVTAAYP